MLDVGDLRSGDLKAYRAAVPVGDAPLTLGVLDQTKEMLLTRILRAWSLQLPIPGEDPASLDKLPIPAYRALVDALEPYIEAFESTPDPKPSNGSAGTSVGSPSTSASA